MSECLKRLSIRTAAVLMAGAVVLPLFACSRSEVKNRDDVIADDTPWFEAEYITYAEDVIGGSDSVVPVVTTSDYRVFFERYDEDYNELRRVIAVDTGSNDTYVIDCLDYVDDKNCYIDFNTCFVDGDELYISLNISSESGRENRIYRYDKDTDTFADELTVSFDDKYGSPIIVKAFKRGDLIYLEFNYLEGAIYKYGLKVIGMDGETCFEAVTDGILNDWTVEKSGNIIARLREQDGPEVSDRFISVDPLSGTVTPMEIPSDDMAEYCNGVLMGDACVYSQTIGMTITKYDLHTREYQVIIDYNCCDANLCDLDYSSILYSDEDNLIMTRTVTGIDRPCMFNSLIELTRQDNNPNAGKTILYAAPYDSIGYVDAEAVREYNRSSEEYYICITMDYSVLTMELPYSYNEDEIITRYRLDQAAIGKLEQDIINGDGPDIVLNFGQFYELNDPSYLSGVNSFIDAEQGIDREDYFDNILRAFESNGELYQIPLSVYVTGIYTPEVDRTEGKAGFTFDEYESFVEECCYGNDPIDYMYTQQMAFDILFAYNNSSFFGEDGHIELSNEAFYDLIEYINGLSPDSNPNAQYLTTRVAAFMGIVNDLYYMNISTDPYCLCGFPSDDDTKGPMARVIDSVAVTSCCDHAEEAFGFVKSCLSYDVQSRTLGTNPINRQAYYDYANSLLPSANQYIETMIGVSDYYSSDAIDEYASYLSSATEGQKTDTRIMIIMYEELQSYFSGDKTADEVIAVIENRVNNMIDE